jgi:riboflavin-specific deaminase-like protein
MTLSISTAASLNGVITPARGESSRGLISVLGVPPEVLEWQLEIRRRHDAVLVGTRTVLVDDPSLTSHGRPAVRATVDPSGRIPRSSRFFDGSARTLVGVSGTTPREYLDFLAERSVETIAAGEDRIDLRRFLAALAERGLANVVAEGGGTLNRALLDAGLVDRLHLVLIPIVLDAGSVNLFEGPGFTRFRLESSERLGDYLLLSYTPDGRENTHFLSRKV